MVLLFFDLHLEQLILNSVCGANSPARELVRLLDAPFQISNEVLQRGSLLLEQLSRALQLGNQVRVHLDVRRREQLATRGALPIL